MTKRLLILCLAILMALTFGACSASPAATSTPASVATEAPTASPVATVGPAVTLEVFSMCSNASGLQAGWWTNFLKEKLNIEIDLMPSGDQGQQKLAALMAGGELPDIVVFLTKKQVEDAVRGNMLLCLDDNLAKLPNVTANAAKALQYYRDTVSSGKAYAIPNQVGPAEVGDDLMLGPLLRWDLYKKLGMPEVKTLEDYLPLLKKMQDLEPKTADGQKVYGITLWKDWDNTSMQQAGIPGTINGIGVDDNIGVTTPFLQVNYVTGETMSILDPTSAYIRGLKFYFEANQMGLVDPDSLTQRYNTAVEKITQGRVLFSWYPWFSSVYNTPDKTNAAEFKGFRPVFTSDYKVIMWGDSTVGSSWAWAIGASTKNPDTCLKYVDFMYSTDGLMTLFNGPKGVTWDIGSDGKPAYTQAGWDYIDNQTELPGGGKIGDGVAVVNSYGLSGMFLSPELNATIKGTFWDSSKGRKPTKLLQDWQTTTGYKSNAEMVMDKNLFVKTPLAIKLVPSITDDMQTLSTEIGDVVKTYSWKMVFAKNQAEFDSLLKEMTDSANGLGIDKLIEWDNQAWKTAQDEAAKYK